MASKLFLTPPKRMESGVARLLRKRRSEVEEALRELIAEESERREATTSDLWPGAGRAA